MSDPIRSLREELARQLCEQGADSPQVEHLRWQLVSFERLARRSNPMPAPVDRTREGRSLSFHGR